MHRPMLLTQTDNSSPDYAISKATELSSRGAALEAKQYPITKRKTHAL